MLKIKSAQYPNKDFADVNVRRIQGALADIQIATHSALTKMEKILQSNPHISAHEVMNVISYELGQISRMTAEGFFE